MKAKTLFFLFLFSIKLFGQNLISNPGFEISSDCPTDVGQTFLLDAWEEIIICADFYDCEFTTSFFPTNSFANSGTGYAGFGIYGNLNGSSEALGQIMSTPLYPDKTYNLEIAAKKPNGGMNMSNCGGITIYGFKEVIQGTTNNMHISEYDDAIFLGVTDSVENIEWSNFEAEITPQDTINFIVFSTEKVSFCRQYIFVDDIFLELDISSNIEEFSTTQFDVYPNPFQSSIQLDFEKEETIISLEIYNELGQRVFVTNGFKDEVDVSYLSVGIYFLKATDEVGDIFTKKIVKSR